MIPEQRAAEDTKETCPQLIERRVRGSDRSDRASRSGANHKERTHLRVSETASVHGRREQLDAEPLPAAAEPDSQQEDRERERASECEVSSRTQRRPFRQPQRLVRPGRSLLARLPTTLTLAFASSLLPLSGVQRLLLIGIGACYRAKSSTPAALRSPSPRRPRS